MTRKNFEALAEMLRRATPVIRDDADGRAYVQWQIDCQAVCQACRGFSDKFSCTRFIDACEGR